MLFWISQTIIQKDNDNKTWKNDSVNSLWRHQRHQSDLRKSSVSLVSYDPPPTGTMTWWLMIMILHMLQHKKHRRAQTWSVSVGVFTSRCPSPAVSCVGCSRYFTESGGWKPTRGNTRDVDTYSICVRGWRTLSNESRGKLRGLSFFHFTESDQIRLSINERKQWIINV